MSGAVKFLPNRVWRVYRGGSGIDRLRSATFAADGHFPEDWIASTTPANNPQYESADQGFSRIVSSDGAMLFRDYLESAPEYALGAAHHRKFGCNPAFLMKILDSAERLPIQVHPTLPDARRFFNSDFGKTEAWYVVATRTVNGEEPCLFMGFNEELDEQLFRQEALSGNFSDGSNMLHRLNVRPGDCYLVPGGLPHAIGSGVTLIEIMEPSDLVVQPERYCGKQPLSDAERWSNAEPEDALCCFDYKAETEAEVRKRCTPPIKKLDDSLSIIIPRESAQYFEVQKLVCNGNYHLVNREKCHRAGVVVSGALTLKDCRGGELELNCGDAFFLPFAMPECEFTGTGEVIFALPPALKETAPPLP